MKKRKQPIDAKTASARKKRRSRVTNVILVLILLLGAGITAYPTFSDWWNSFHQSRAIATYASVVEESDPELLAGMLDDAHAYNVRLLQKLNRYELTDAERAEYEALLNLSGDGVMGYIQINSIGVSLPVYHGTDESVLQIAIGHIEGTSLPVGGESTHAVVSGHRGLPSAKLFTDLDKLAGGDTFTVTVLNQTATYEVDQVLVVEPEDMSALNIVSGGDYVTLVTCTPYGINTHRMLVRGHRIENIEGEYVVLAEGALIPSYVAVPAVAVPLLFVYLLLLLTLYRRKSVVAAEEALLKALTEHGAPAETETDPPEGAESITPPKADDHHSGDA